MPRSLREYLADQRVGVRLALRAAMMEPSS